MFNPLRYLQTEKYPSLNFEVKIQRTVLIYLFSPVTPMSKLLITWGQPPCRQLLILFIIISIARAGQTNTENVNDDFNTIIAPGIDKF